MTYTAEALNNAISLAINEARKQGLTPIQVIGVLDFTKHQIETQYMVALIKQGKIIRMSE